MAPAVIAQPLVYLAAGIFVGLGLSKLLALRFDGRVSRAPQVQAFCLNVIVEFASPNDKTAFLELFKPLAEYVTSYERNTVSYKLSESDKNPLRVHILERYADKENAFLKEYRNSKAFTEFRAAMAKMQDAKQITLVDGHSYLERQDLGFV